ncbi:MAG: HAD family hydrolase [Candidatus Hydrogenedentes bacterium]|nr:HAD family hydrolase [Candidatus Hydrogenedentota bacterium]
MEYPYLLLDAGGTLLFPDQDLLARTVAAEGSVLEPERVYEAHFRLLHQYDTQVRDTSGVISVSLRDFFRDMLVRAGAANGVAERAVDKLVARHEETSLWTYTKPWVAETLAALKRDGIRMSVISNSDGRVRRQLDACGVTPYLEAVFDSGIVGIEKPDPGLFLHAMSELGITPNEAVYVGDNYHIDVVGANRAGIGAVHLDPLACYGDWPGLHLRDIRALPEWIAEVRSDPTRFDLFPAGG